MRSLRGARQRARLYTSDSLCDGGPVLSTQTASTAPTAPTADCASRVHRPSAPRRATGLPTPTAAPARSSARPRAEHGRWTGPSSHGKETVYVSVHVGIHVARSTAPARRPCCFGSFLSAADSFPHRRRLFHQNLEARAEVNYPTCDYPDRPDRPVSASVTKTNHRKNRKRLS